MNNFISLRNLPCNRFKSNFLIGNAQHKNSNTHTHNTRYLKIVTVRINDFTVCLNCMDMYELFTMKLDTDKFHRLNWVTVCVCVSMCVKEKASD